MDGLRNGCGELGVGSGCDFVDLCVYDCYLFCDGLGFLNFLGVLCFDECDVDFIVDYVWGHVFG